MNKKKSTKTDKRKGCKERQLEDYKKSKLAGLTNQLVQYLTCFQVTQ